MRKIFSIIAIVLIVGIVASLITLSLVKTDYNELNIGTDVQEIVVYKGSLEGSFTPNNIANPDSEEVYNKIIELYNKGTKESVLASLFQGAYSESAQPEIVRGAGTVTPTDSALYVRFIFDAEDAPVITLDGEEWIDSDVSENTLQYYSVWVEVEDNATLTKVTAYYQYSEGSYNSYNYKISYLSQHADLYDYILQLEEDGLLF